jgi:hypothetical protein
VDRKLSKPFTFGRSHWYVIGWGDCGVRFKTCSRISAEFAISMLISTVSRTWQHAGITCGVHFGDTNEPASIVVKPVRASLSTSSIFVANGTVSFSFCSPSLGPTSTMRTWSGRLFAAEANVLLRDGWRAARRAERRQMNLADILEGCRSSPRVVWIALG